jgi:hypothetical protein
MKKTDLIPGTKVLVSLPSDEWSDERYVKYYHDTYDEHTLVGTILDKKAKTGKVWLAWDESDHTSQGEEQEMDIEILTLESERSEIENDFREVSKLIKKNMEDAAKLIKESSKLAKKAHASSLADMYDAVRPLVNAMDASGWNSSSWGC